MVQRGTDINDYGIASLHHPLAAVMVREGAVGARPDNGETHLIRAIQTKGLLGRPRYLGLSDTPDGMRSPPPAWPGRPVSPRAAAAPPRP